MDKFLKFKVTIYLKANILHPTIPAKIVGTLRRFLQIFSTDPLPPPPRYNVELRRIFATFGVNLEHASLDQSFLLTNQHCFGGKEGGRREQEDSLRLLNMLWSFSKISLFVSVRTNFGQDCSF